MNARPLEGRLFDRRIDALDAVFEYSRSFFLAHDVPTSVAALIDLAVEEVFTNCIKYQPGSEQPIGIALSFMDHTVRVCIVDSDVERFDVTLPRPVDTTSPVEGRRPGGLGVHLLREIADTLEYEYANRCSRIVFTKRVVGETGSHVRD